MKWYRTVDKLPENDKSYLVWTGQEFVVSRAHVYDDKKKKQMSELADADFIKFQNEEQRERFRHTTGKFEDFGVHWYFDNPKIYYTELPEPPC